MSSLLEEEKKLNNNNNNNNLQITDIIDNIIDDDNNNNNNNNNNSKKNKNKNNLVSIDQLNERTTLKISSEDINNNNNNNNNNNYNINKNTLNEPISQTIFRDLNSIYFKLKFVINPFINQKIKSKHIKNWDLYGPLLFTILLSSTLAFQSHNQKSNIFSLVFIIFWFGSFLIYLNANLLEIKISIFQIFCLLGYCLFPLNLSAFILCLFKFYEIIRIFIVVFGCFWACFSMRGFLLLTANENNRMLVLYPAILFYLFFSVTILMNRF
jgi:hypothetical protein